MPTIIRRVAGESFENHLTLSPDCLDLRMQIEALENWLLSSGMNLDPSHEWVADVGFSPRANATGGGPPLTLDLMRKCVELNLEIYLSEYGVDEETAG